MAAAVCEPAAAREAVAVCEAVAAAVRATVAAAVRAAVTAVVVCVVYSLGGYQVGVLKAYELAAEHQVPSPCLPHITACLTALLASQHCLPHSVLQIPIVRVHHMEAHAFVTRIPRGPDQPPPPDFPYATVLVSGGHNMVLLTKGLGDHTILGSTLDDSIGESFDKTARLLGITQVA